LTWQVRLRAADEALPVRYAFEREKGQYGMQIEARVSKVLAEVRAVELSTLTRQEGIHTNPMSSVWLADREQIVLTTPLATPQKVLNIRRDGRVGLLYSDFTGSGLSAPAVLVQGTAKAPDVVLAPQDLADFWRDMVRKYPAQFEQVGSTEYRREMDWYYWRFPIFVAPLRIHIFEAVSAGGAWEPPVPKAASMHERVQDALTRYPTAVFTSKDQQGYPYSVRAAVSEVGNDGQLRVSPEQPFAGLEGLTSLLWHRHNGHAGELSSLLVAGIATHTNGEWIFVPQRIPGKPSLDAMSYEDWVADARARSLRYLEKRGMQAPSIDWSVFDSPD
jgi:hypothetical protein